jgi:hypothetical protein
MTTRAVAILEGDEPLAIIGVAYGIDCATFYSDYKPELDLHRITVMRAVKLAMTLVKDCAREVYAVRLENTDLLPKLGFVHEHGEVYRWPS